MKMKNMGKATYRIEIGSMPGQPPMVHEVKPGDVCDLPEAYCTKAWLDGCAPAMAPYVEEAAPAPAPPAPKKKSDKAE
jgi:hypothetical protein